MPPLVTESPQSDESSSSVQPDYSLEVHTEKDRTDLVPDGEDEIKILARITSSVEGADVSSILDTVTFEPEGSNADWLEIGSSSPDGDTITVSVKARPPTEDAEPADDGQATVVVTAVINETTETRRVTLNLLTYEVRFT